MKGSKWMISLMFAGVGFGAKAIEVPVSQGEVEMLRQEVSVLRSQLTEQQQRELNTVPKRLPDGLELGAVIEVEAGYSSTQPADERDITLATVEISAGWQLTDWLRGDLVFLYEEDDTEPMEMDQAIVTLGNTEKVPLFLQAGQMYVPFGNLDSFFISDPVVLELAETRETAVLLGFEKGGLCASLTAFNGEVETAGNNQVDNFVAAVSYGLETENASFNFGGAWIRNIMDSDGLTGVLEDAGYLYTSEETGGLDLWATATLGKATLIAEYVKVLDSIEVDGADTGIQPESLNLELGYALTDRLEIAAKYGKSSGVSDWFPENRYGLVGSYRLMETDICSSGLALEYMKEDFTAGGEDADVVTAQLALEF